VNVVIGTPIYRNGAYAIDKFLSNQEEIQRTYPASELVLATSENDFFGELEGLVRSSRLRATIFHYGFVKPDYARSNLWDIAGGREAIRKYVLSQTQARYMLFLDADMTFEPSVIATMEREIQGYDAVFSGYPLHQSAPEAFWRSSSSDATSSEMVRSYPKTMYSRWTCSVWAVESRKASSSLSAITQARRKLDTSFRNRSDSLESWPTALLSGTRS